MKMGQYPLSFLCGLLAAFGLGIFYSAWMHISFVTYAPYLICLLLAAALTSTILVLKSSERTWIAFVGLFFMLGIFRFAAAYELPAHDISYMAGQEGRITGTIAEPPRVTRDADGVQHIRYTVAAQTVLQTHEERTAHGKLYVYTRTDGAVSALISQRSPRGIRTWELLQRMAAHLLYGISSVSDGAPAGCRICLRFPCSETK